MFLQFNSTFLFYAIGSLVFTIKSFFLYEDILIVYLVLERDRYLLRAKQDESVAICIRSRTFLICLGRKRHDSEDGILQKYDMFYVLYVSRSEASNYFCLY